MSEIRKSAGKIIKKRVRQWAGGKARPCPQQPPKKQTKPKWEVVGNIYDNPDLRKEVFKDE